MKMSAKGRVLLTKREGVRLHAYQDSIGVWTIGVGHTSMAGPPYVNAGLTITKDECDQILSRDLVQYEQAVAKAVHVPMTQNQFDALTSLCFNIGAGNFAKSMVVKKLNAGDVRGAADAILNWNKAGGQVINGLVKRRAAEREQFLDGVPPSDAPIPPPKPQAPKTGIAAAIAAAFAAVAAFLQEYWFVIGGVVLLGALAFFGWRYSQEVRAWIGRIWPGR